MFCSKCGAENPDSGKFCSGCGSALQQQTSSVAAANKPPLMEAISFTEHPSREQTTIDMHQKMGWSLKSSQEINSSTTHVYGQSYNGTGQINSYVVKEHYVKLTFERNKNMPNYDILKGKYDEFCALSHQIEELEASIHKRSGKFYFRCALPSIIIFLLSAVISIANTIGNPYSLGAFGVVSTLFIMLLFCGGLLIPIILIADKATEGKVRKKVAPTVNELYAKMGNIADEAERYL